MIAALAANTNSPPVIKYITMVEPTSEFGATIDEGPVVCSLIMIISWNYSYLMVCIIYVSI